MPGIHRGKMSRKMAPAKKTRAVAVSKEDEPKRRR